MGLLVPPFCDPSHLHPHKVGRNKSLIFNDVYWHVPPSYMPRVRMPVRVCVGAGAQAGAHTRPPENSYFSYLCVGRGTSDCHSLVFSVPPMVSHLLSVEG